MTIAPDNAVAQLPNELPLDDQALLRLKELDATVTDLRVSIGKAEGPWYTKPATWISILALVVTIANSIFTSTQQHNEDVRSNRRDVRAIIQRLIKLPIENFELMERNKNNPSGQALNSMINQENVLLANQAAELIERFPSSFDSPEYFAIANALQNSNIIAKVPGMYRHAIESAANANDYVAASRGYGGYLYNQGSHTEARSQYQNAIDVWKIFPERNPTTVNYFDLMTYMIWAYSAFNAGQGVEAKEYLKKAEETLARLPQGQFQEQLRAQVEAAKSVIGR